MSWRACSASFWARSAISDSFWHARVTSLIEALSSSTAEATTLMDDDICSAADEMELILALDSSVAAETVFA
ncbi:MAG: hypothetical protein BWY82_02840 [Verrucomicrobia bacterium ADurb.Bin474]|nr:MAG: hypothetical protein BWY82_02840 [Verrucomicrobia bacterium ADurb.Bin474]